MKSYCHTAGNLNRIKKLVWDSADAYEWRADYEVEKQQIMQALHIHDSATILACLFKRLLALQQQLLQGGATYNSAINRKQLSHANTLLCALMPCFIQILLENLENVELSQPFYPVMQMS